MKEPYLVTVDNFTFGNLVAIPRKYQAILEPFHVNYSLHKVDEKFKGVDMQMLMVITWLSLA